MGLPILIIRASPTGGWLQDLYSIAPDGSRLTLIARGVRRPGRDEDHDCEVDGGVRHLCAPIIFARWSPDHHRVAFIRGGFGLNLGLYVKSAAAGGETRLAFGDVADLDWSPNGHQIVYSMPFRGVFVTNSRQATPRRIGPPPPITGDGYHVAWSPDGKQIAYIRAAKELWVTDPSGRHKRLLYRRTGDAGINPLDGPAWSADSRRIAYTIDEHSFLSHDEQYMYMIGRDGHGRRQIATYVSDSDSVRWAPRGTALAYQSDWNCWARDDESCLGHDNQFVVKRSPASAPEWLDDDPDAFHVAGLPGTTLAWSPDAKQIAFYREVRDASATGIYIKTLDRPGLTKVLVGHDAAPIDW